MSNEKYALSPAAVEAINNMSGAYSAPFWDGILEVSGTLDTGSTIKVESTNTQKADKIKLIKRKERYLKNDKVQRRI